MHDQRGKIFLARLGLAKRKIEHALGFRIHAPRHVETRKIDPRRHALLGGGARSRGDQPIQPLHKIFLLVAAPFVDIEDRANRCRRALGADVRR